MPALAKYKEHTYKVTWLGEAKHGPHKGERRARLVPLVKGAGAFWCDAREITFVDTPPAKAGGKMASAGKDE